MCVCVSVCAVCTCVYDHMYVSMHVFVLHLDQCIGVCRWMCVYSCMHVVLYLDECIRVCIPVCGCVFG